MLLNTLQCTGQPLHQRVIQPKMSVLPKPRNPGLSQPVTVKSRASLVNAVKVARENGLALLWDNTPCRAAGPFHANVAAPLSQIRQEFRVAARVHQSHLTQSPLGSINRFMPDHPSLSQAFLPFNKAAFINTHGYHVPLPRLPSRNQPNTSTSPSNKNYHHLQT